MSTSCSGSLHNEKQMRVLSFTDENSPLLRKTNSRFYVPKRYILSLLTFVVCALAVSFNISLSIAIVSMVNRTNEATSWSNGTDHLQGVSLDWDAGTQSAALGAVYYGQMVSVYPGGRLAELYGGKKILLLSTLVASVTTLFLPVAAVWSSHAFVCGRIVIGIATGPVIPVIYYLLGKWIPVTERNFHASFIIAGYGIGSFLAIIISGALCGSTFLNGWPSVYYIGGSCGILWCLVAYFLMYEVPELHPAISCKELKYITKGLENEKHVQILNVAWKQLLLSVPLWALAIGFFGQFWLLGFFSTVHAVYMGTVLNLSVVQDGILSSLPHLIRAIAGCAASYPVDIILKNRTVSVGFVRKSATVINSLVASAAFLGIIMVGCDTAATTILFILGNITGEFVTFGVCMACIDMAPDLAGTVSGIINTIGVFPFFLIPVLVKWLTNYEPSIILWHQVFYATIVITVVTTLIFVLFGDLQPQNWGIAPEVKTSLKFKENSKYGGGNLEQNVIDNN